MKILHIINSLDSGGAQAVLADLVTHWPEAADHHHVISLRPGGKHMQRLRGAGILAEVVRSGRLGLAVASLAELSAAIRANHPDVVHTWLYHASLLGSVAVRAVGRSPIVWGLHHTLAGRESLKLPTWAAVRVLAALSNRLPAAIVCCSQSSLRSHAIHGYARARMTVVKNGVDTDEFRPDPAARAAVREELGVQPHTRLIGMFARYHPQKNHATMLAAAAILATSMPEVGFVLAGEGLSATNAWLRGRLGEGGIEDRFHLLGERQDVARLCAAMDVVTLSSSHGEAMPRIIAEAMSSGVPCVATSVGDTAALIGDGGLVVEPRRPPELADAWRRLLALPQSEYARVAARARERIVQSYDLPTMVSGYRAVYMGVAGGA